MDHPTSHVTSCRTGIAVLIAATLALPGCGVRAGMPPSAAPLEPSAAFERYVSSLQPGTRVVAQARGGERFKATLLGLDAGAVALKPRTRIPVPERRIPIRDLELLEIEESGDLGAGRAVLIGVAAGVTTFFALLLTAVAVAD